MYPFGLAVPFDLWEYALGEKQNLIMCGDLAVKQFYKNDSLA